MPKRTKPEAQSDVAEPAKRRSERLKDKPINANAEPKPKPKPKKGPAKTKKTKEVEKAKPEEKEADAPTENGEAKADDEAPATEAGDQEEEAAE